MSPFIFSLVPFSASCARRCPPLPPVPPCPLLCLPCPKVPSSASRAPIHPSSCPPPPSLSPKPVQAAVTTAPRTAEQAPYPGAAGLRRPGGPRAAGKRPRSVWGRGQQWSSTTESQDSSEQPPGLRPRPDRPGDDVTRGRVLEGGAASADAQNSPAAPGAAGFEPEARGVAASGLRPPRGGSGEVPRGPEAAVSDHRWRKWWCLGSAGTVDPALWGPRCHGWGG